MRDRLLRFAREYFEYPRAAEVFKDADMYDYQPLWLVEDADQFILRILDEDQDVLRQWLTSQRFYTRGMFNYTGGRTFLRQFALSTIGGIYLVPILSKFADAAEGITRKSPRFVFVIEGIGLPPLQIQPHNVSLVERAQRTGVTNATIDSGGPMASPNSRWLNTPTHSHCPVV